MCYFSGELYHHNKFFLVAFRFQSDLSLGTCAFLFNWCSCPCSLRVICVTLIHILCLTFLERFITSLRMFFPCSTVTVLAWRSTFVFMSQLYTSINNIIAERIVAALQPLRPIFLSFPSSLYVLVLWCSSCWKKKNRNLWIITENYSFIYA